jgi:CRP-like cAMP-binding protein
MVVEHLINIGRRGAAVRVAHFLLELGARLAVVGLGSKAGYACPLTQYLLADALGLSSVHVNRVLRQLRDKGMVTFRDGFVTFDDYGRLTEFAGFDPEYLDQIGPLLK